MVSIRRSREQWLRHCFHTPRCATTYLPVSSSPRVLSDSADLSTGWLLYPSLYLHRGGLLSATCCIYIAFRSRRRCSAQTLKGRAMQPSSGKSAMSLNGKFPPATGPAALTRERKVRDHEKPAAVRRKQRCRDPSQMAFHHQKANAPQTGQSGGSAKSPLRYRIKPDRPVPARSERRFPNREADLDRS
jgi:hypothetical protein